MARVNIDILAISEPKMDKNGQFNSDDHYIYYCGQELIRINGVGLAIKENTSKSNNNILENRDFRKWE